MFVAFLEYGNVILLGLINNGLFNTLGAGV